MTRGVYCATPDLSLRELTRELVTRKATGAPVVDEQGFLVGVISFSDVAVDGAFGEKSLGERKVEEVMSRRVVTIDQAAPLMTAVQKFQKHRVHRLVVTHNDRVVGVLSPIDLLGAILERTGYPTVL